MSEMNNVEKKRSFLKGFKTFAFLLVALALVGTLVACGGGKSEKSKSGAKETIAVSLKDSATGMSVEPKEIKVKSGDNVVLNVTNDGSVPHNLYTESGEGTADLVVNAAAELEIGEVTENLVVFCNIAGHRDQGMEANIVVE